MNRLIVAALSLVLALVQAHTALGESLWAKREIEGKKSLFSDRRAFRVGDIITVVITEDSTASANANTNAKRSSDIDMQVKKWIQLFVKMGLLFNHEIKATPVSSNLPAIQTEAENEFKSSGSTVRSQKLEARVTTRIIEILANGDFYIEGKKAVKINEEEQQVILSGIVRPEDILPDNTIPSTKIGDLKVVCTGLGAIGDKQKRGILESAFDLLWLF